MLSETPEIIQDNLDYYFDFIQVRTELNSLNRMFYKYLTHLKSKKKY
jgi:hypothetical protein